MKILISPSSKDMGNVAKALDGSNGILEHVENSNHPENGFTLYK